MQKMQVEIQPSLNLVKNSESIAREANVLHVITYPDPTLSVVSSPVLTSIPHDSDLQDLLRDMEKTLDSYRALGLAAIQVGVSLRILLVKDGAKTLKLINPVIVSVEETTEYETEGCLSIPGIFTRIVRPRSLIASYFNENGDRVTEKYSGLTARAIHHEMDHLNGITFLSRMTNVQKESQLKKFSKIKKNFL